MPKLQAISRPWGRANSACDAFARFALLFVVHAGGGSRNTRTIRDELRAFYTPLTPHVLVWLQQGGHRKKRVCGCKNDGDGKNARRGSAGKCFFRAQALS